MRVFVPILSWFGLIRLGFLNLARGLLNNTEVSHKPIRVYSHTDTLPSAETLRRT